MRVLPGALATTLVAGLLTLASGVGPAQASTTLPMTSFADIVVDQAHAKVYVSGGTLAVADLDGNVTGSVAGVSSAGQMTLTSDGSQLVVANADGLTVVDASTATVLRTISTGANSCPSAVAPASGKIFFAYGNCSGGTAGLGAVDLSNDAITTGLLAGGIAQLASVAAAPNMLAARAGGTLEVLDTTGGVTPAASVRATSSAADSNFQDLALTPDGTKVITASGGIYRHQVFSTTDLSHVGDFQTSSYPNAVAVRSDGMVAAGLDAAYDDDVWFYPSGATATSRRVDFGDTHTWLVAGGLAFGAKRVYAVSTDIDTGAQQLHAITPGPPPTLSVSASKSLYSYRADAVVTATLASPTTNRTLNIYSTPAGYTSKKLLKSGSVDAVTGKLSVTIPDISRNTLITVTFAGDDDYAATTAARTLKVAAKVALSSSSTSKSGIYHRLKASPSPSVRGAVYPAKPSTACVKVVAQIYRSSAWHSFGSIDCINRSSTTGGFSLKLIDFPPGLKFRVKATYLATTANASMTTPWYYIVFT